MQSVRPNITAKEMRKLWLETMRAHQESREEEQDRSTEKLLIDILDLIKRRMEKKIEKMEVRLVTYDPLRGSDYVIEHHHQNADFDKVIAELTERGFESELEKSHSTKCNCILEDVTDPCVLWLKVKECWVQGEKKEEEEKKEEKEKEKEKEEKG